METEKNILSGPTLSVTLPADLSLGQFMLDHIGSHGDSVALIDGVTNEEITFAEILSKSVKLAIYLCNEGLKKDDRIVVCSENSLNYGIPVCSALYLGVAICPLNPGYSHQEFLHALNICKANYIFASKAMMKTLMEIARELSWSPRVICMEKFSVENVPCMDDLIDSIEAPNLEKFRSCEVNPRDHVVAILCSSGTTGLAKGVMLTDNNFLTVNRAIMDITPNFLSPDTPSLALLPYFHSYAFGTMLNQFIRGSRAVVMPRFDPERFLTLIEKYKIHTLIVVPPLVVFLAKSPLVDRYDLSSVKSIWSGAAPLSPEIEKTVCKRLNVPKVHQGYGLTETTLGVVNTLEKLGKYGSIGRLKPGLLAKVIPLDGDKSKGALGPNETGELCFKGDVIMKGYCGDVSATATIIDADGWLHTGDIGYYDADGYFFIVDRLKELIKYKAFQVPPAELEAVLLTHPNVVDAAVVGIPDEMSGELPLAFVVKQPGSSVTASEIEKFVNGKVSSQKWLRGGVRFLEAIPKTASGKILRRELRASLRSKL